MKEDKRIAFLTFTTDQPDGHLSTPDVEWIEAFCEDIESGEIYFECTGYEVYGENHWDSDLLRVYSSKQRNCYTKKITFKLLNFMNRFA